MRSATSQRLHPTVRMRHELHKTFALDATQTTLAGERGHQDTLNLYQTCPSTSFYSAQDG